MKTAGSSETSVNVLHTTGVMFKLLCNSSSEIKIRLTRKNFQIINLMHNPFIFQQYVCYTTILNMFRAARCSKHVEDRSVTYILLKNKRIVH